MEIGWVIGGMACLAWVLERWWRAHRSARCYHDGLFQIIAILDLPLEEWERKLRGTMTDSEWFGFQRGYQQALVHALTVLQYPLHIHVHGAKLQPTPDAHESLSDYAKRP